ncbi:MAG TPA: 7-carboxy-7-deazaguanine synthase QueE [Bacteroidaceae bacterium]|nr:7-carboxy-7-deazaguanine synthase QueE [Bacteroidaceae bacterium]
MFEDGQKIPLVEEFYSIQGEGFHTGKAAYFIRIGGCDVGCSWCDTKFSWDPTLHPLVAVDPIVENALKYPAKAVVVTGGEPLMVNLDYLTGKLKKHGIRTFLETSGTRELSGTWDWICLSPKKNCRPVNTIYKLANELKVIIAVKEDFEWAVENARLVSADCLLFLQPEWSVSKQMMPEIVKFVKENPKWHISLQAHKYMRIP